MSYLVTTLYLWVIFVRINPLVVAIVPTFHSLQYLVVVWRYQINATEAHAARGQRSLARPPRTHAAVAAVAAGRGSSSCSASFWAISASTACPTRSTAGSRTTGRCSGRRMFLFMFYIFINVHHYFLDNVMWRRGNPDVKTYLFARADMTRAFDRHLRSSCR